ncbi:DUF3187 family protein [Anaeromyxobacter diazotrophicus]|uniref:DUF3187 family protein n=1 Tax=Anaeromyxobacter diazotrophicus TaxID=2590199 RepID=UPI0015912681|nr:DUF3187 family protein [Anaeromyxobacter diazotrophicus]
MRLLLPLLAALVAVAPAAPAAAELPPAAAGASFGAAPLGLGTPGPFRQLFLDPPLSDARAVGTPSLSARLESANSWSVPALFGRGGRVVAVQNDVEADALVLSVRLPWTLLAPGGFRERLTTTLGWRATAFWGGFEDGGIEAWHGLVGAYNFQRQLYPRDHIHLRLLEPGGPRALDLESGRFSAGDLVLATQALLASGGRAEARGSPPEAPAWGISARLDLKLPTGSLAQAGGSGGFDAGVALLGSFELTRWAVLHGMLFGTATSALASSVALQPRTFHAGVDLSLAVLLGPVTLLAEDRYLSALMEGGWTSLDGGSDDAYISSAYAALFRPHNQVSFGLRWRELTLSFSEDFTPGSNPRGARSWFYNENAPDTVLALTFTLPL